MAHPDTEKTIFDLIMDNDTKRISTLLAKNHGSLEAYDPTHYEDTPLHCAIRLGKTDIISLLIQHGAPLERRNSFNDTPLHLAAIEGNNNAVTLLLAAGADTDARNNNNKTPRSLAQEYKHHETVRLFDSYHDKQS